MKKIMGVVMGVAAILMQAQVYAQSASTSGGIVLKQAVGARAQGMGEAFAGIADDATALYWNVAGLGKAKGTEISASYLMGIAESSYQQVMVSQGLEKAGGVGLGLVMLQGGSVELDDGSSVQSQSDMVLSAGYGTSLGEKLTMGVGLKYLSSTLAEDVSASAIGVDAGALLSVNESLNVGVSLQNAGTEIKYKESGDPLPLTARIGAGYKVKIAAQHEGCLGADVVKVNDADVRVHLGAEYWYDKTVSVRLGYKAGYDLEGLTAGLGLAYQMMQLDYAFGMVQELDSTHKVSLTLRL